MHENYKCKCLLISQNADNSIWWNRLDIKYSNKCDERDSLRTVLKYSVSLKKIIQLMEDKYNISLEGKVDEFVETYKKTGSYPHNYPGFKKLKPI